MKVWQFAVLLIGLALPTRRPADGGGTGDRKKYIECGRALDRQSGSALRLLRFPLPTAVSAPLGYAYFDSLAHDDVSPSALRGVQVSIGGFILRADSNVDSCTPLAGCA